MQKKFQHHLSQLHRNIRKCKNDMPSLCQSDDLFLQNRNRLLKYLPKWLHRSSSTSCGPIGRSCKVTPPWWHLVWKHYCFRYIIPILVFTSPPFPVPVPVVEAFSDTPCVLLSIFGYSIPIPVHGPAKSVVIHHMSDSSDFVLLYSSFRCVFVFLEILPCTFFGFIFLILLYLAYVSSFVLTLETRV